MMLLVLVLLPAALAQNCTDNPCPVDSTCIPSDPASFSCNCTTPNMFYNATSNMCEPGVCASNPCPIGSTCVSSDGVRYTCTSPCAQQPCQNGGTCSPSSSSSSGFACTCAAGFTDTLCQTAINYCSSNPCVNNGKCYTLTADYLCTCPLEYGGSTCQTQISTVYSVAATFLLQNMNFGWYSADIHNVAAFDVAFINMISKQFAVSKDSVVIQTVTQGSLIVRFRVIEPDIDTTSALAETMRGFIDSPNPSALASLAAALPAAALEDPTMAITLDQDNSFAEGHSPQGDGPSGGVIAGVIIGCLVGLGLMVLGVYFVQTKLRRRAHEDHVMFE